MAASPKSADGVRGKGRFGGFREHCGETGEQAEEEHDGSVGCEGTVDVDQRSAGFVHSNTEVERNTPALQIKCCAGSDAAGFDRDAEGAAAGAAAGSGEAR